MALDNKEQQDAHTMEYYRQMGLDVKKLLKKKLSSLITAESPPIKIPEVEGDPLGGPALPGGPMPAEAGDNGDIESVKHELETLRNTLEKIDLEHQIDTVKEELTQEFTNTIRELQSELSEIKDRKVPEAGGVDTGGVYREKVFEAATFVLDKVLLDLFHDIPDYSLIANQISRVYEDGTISDGIIVIGVTMPNHGQRYDFKVDIPILNGIIQYPTYIQRGLKIIPLTEDKVQEELNSMAYRTMDIIEPYTKDNIFNNIGDNRLRKFDNQKWYDVQNNEPKPSGIPLNSTWNPGSFKEDPNEYRKR